MSGSLVKSCLTLCSPHRLQHAVPHCPPLSPGVCSNSCPLSRWWHWTISSIIIPFSSCLQSFPASGSFPMIQLQSMGSQQVRHDWAAKQWKWMWQQFMRYSAATTGWEGWPSVCFATIHIVPMGTHLSCLADKHSGVNFPASCVLMPRAFPPFISPCITPSQTFSPILLSTYLFTADNRHSSWPSPSLLPTESPLHY